MMHKNHLETNLVEDIISLEPSGSLAAWRPKAMTLSCDVGSWGSVEMTKTRNFSILKY